MTSKSFRYTALTLNLLEKILGSNFSVTGIENLPDNPIMFVANHFTRSETFFVPHLIYKYTNRQVRCLADSDLYHGLLGRFLESVGTIAVNHPNRDKIIVSDLISGEYDWMIYPEGSMLKNKEVNRKESLYINSTPYRIGPVRTGSAVLALKSHLYRQEMIEASNSGNLQRLQELEKTYAVKYDDNFKQLQTFVVPLTVSYYPIRPGKNRLQFYANKIIEKIPPRLAEELEIEGNLLMSSEINLYFGEAINLSDYSQEARDLIYQIPIIKSETKSNFIIKYFKNRLTSKFMGEIYANLQVNLDHIFIAALEHISEKEIEIEHFKRIIYLSASMIKKCGRYRTNQSIDEENLFKIFTDEAHKEFDDVFALAKKLGDIEEISGRRIIIHRSFLYKKYDFHRVRLENTLQVIANEFSLLEFANDIVKRNCKLSFKEARNKVFAEICKKDQEIFEADYQIYFDKEFSKDRSIGRPFFIDSSVKSSPKIKKIGILICHGYKASPKEVEDLAKFFNGFGFKVYAVRMKGHGTTPINIKDTSWQDWYNSMQRGYAALRTVCSKVIVVGFSTGGLLALLSTSRKNHGVAAVVSINAALKLRDIRARMVRGINLWNEMLDKIHIDAAKFEYVDDASENPNFNYTRNYLKGVEELGKLMQECNENLAKISAPSLIIQADKDPVVDPISGLMIYEKISSTDKFLFEPNFNNHIIIGGNRKEEIFAIIKDFLHKMNLS